MYVENIRQNIIVELLNQKTMTPMKQSKWTRKHLIEQQKRSLNSSLHTHAQMPLGEANENDYCDLDLFSLRLLPRRRRENKTAGKARNILTYIS